MKKGTVELRLAVADSRLTFRVMRGGQPVEGMRVYATYSDGWGVLGRRRQGGLVTYMPLGVMLRPSEVLEAETDAQGRVEWEGVSSGEYIIETVGVRSRLWKAKAGSSEVTIDIGEALAGETQRIAGTVFDGGKPAQGHAVELWSGERMMSKSVTRPDGAFLLVLQGSFPGPSEIRVGDFRMPVAEVPRTNIVVDLSH